MPIETYDIQQSRRHAAKLKVATENLETVRESLKRCRDQFKVLTHKGADTSGLAAKIISLEAAEKRALRDFLSAQEPCLLVKVVVYREAHQVALAELRSCRNELLHTISKP